MIQPKEELEIVPSYSSVSSVRHILMGVPSQSTAYPCVAEFSPANESNVAGIDSSSNNIHDNIESDAQADNNAFPVADAQAVAGPNAGHNDAKDDASQDGSDDDSDCMILDEYVPPPLEINENGLAKRHNDSISGNIPFNNSVHTAFIYFSRFFQAYLFWPVRPH